MRVAIVLSVMAHAGALGWASLGNTSAAAIVSGVPAAPPTPAPPDPIEIQWLGAVELVPSVDVAVTTERGRATDPAHLGVATRTATWDSEAQTGDPKPVDPGRAPHMAMRTAEQPGLPSLQLPPAFVDEFLRHQTSLPPIADLPGARIDAEIAELQHRLRNAGEGYDRTADRMALVKLREARKKVELKRQKDGTYQSEKTTFVAKVDSDGKVHVTDKANIQPAGLGLRFDVLDALMRSNDNDPYASQKLLFVDRTRDQRVAIGKENSREVLSRSGQLMAKNVERLWATTINLRARKEGLFELWDECAETGDEDLVAGGAAARQFLVSFIQLKLRGADAYTSAELATLNAQRKSNAEFAPYE